MLVYASLFEDWNSLMQLICVKLYFCKIPVRFVCFTFQICFLLETV